MQQQEEIGNVALLRKTRRSMGKSKEDQCKLKTNIEEEEEGGRRRRRRRRVD